MQSLGLPRSAALGGALLFASSILLAQQPADSAPRAAGGGSPTNPFASLPYGAPDEKPVSRWTPPASAGRQLTLNDLMTWKQIRNASLSNDGKWFAYVLAPNEGDGEVVIRGTGADAREWRFPIGDPTALNRGGTAPAGPPSPAAASALVLSGNNRWAAFLVYPGSAAGRGRRPGGAAAPQTRLAVVELGTGTRREFENVRSFRFAGDKSDWLALHHGSPSAGAGGSTGATGATGGGGGASAPSATGTVLELVNLGGGTPVPIANVSEFAFEDGGDWMAYALSVSDQLGNGLQVRQLSTGITRSLDARKAAYRRITWADSSLALAALRVVTDTSAQATNEEQVTALLWTSAATAAAAEIGPDTPGTPAGLVLSGDYALDFGRQANLLFLGLREPRPPRPRPGTGGFTPPNPGGSAPGAGSTGRIAAAPQTDAEVPSLVLWHWKDPRTQATQQIQENSDRSFAYVASYDVAAKKLTRLTDDKARTLQRGPRDTWGVVSDASSYERDAGIKGFAYRDLHAVNLATGERKLIQEKVPGGGGGGFFGGGGQAFAPDDSRYAYYDTGDWKVYEFASGTTRTVTAGVAGKFWDTEDDHNQVKPAIPGGLVGWSRDGGNLLVRDNWDIWRIPVRGGPAVNLTGNGQRDQVRYQNRLVFDSRDRRGIDLKSPLYVETFEEWTKREGLVQVDPLKGGVRPLAIDSAKVDYRRARDAGVWAFTRQTVTKFPDWYAADEGLRNERRLTDANPQQTEVAWTPGALLVEYACENGGARRQAVLYLPAGYEKGKSYPTLTYIYEQLSQEYNVYSQPNATRYSNPSVFTSRGYAFLKPDIVYHVNDPGRSALWCIVPAVQAAIATGVVDRERVGLQGHSWGGYQTAFVTTQTSVFKSAVAGAPLTDLVSMFGSVYWNTGNTDGSIFIASQGRFTGGPNEEPDAYLRNSPQAHAQKLSIPLMILHNDRDGAVDFNQGITYYNHLRQLGKEVVLLEYVGENHGLSRPANQKDYALRLTEWFDTFLRDQPAPSWLEAGIPRLKMEGHLKERRPLVDTRAETPRSAPIP